MTPEVGMTPRMGRAVVVLVTLLSVAAAAQEPRTSVREFVTLAGTVDRIDRVARILTLRVDNNTTQGLYVPPEITLFGELKTGDRVTARIRESVIVSTRPGLKPRLPTETTAEAARGRTATDPELLQQITAVVTIESVDPKAKMVGYRTADNRRVVRGVLDPTLLDGLKPGDVIEVTLTRERVIDLQRQR